jgi:hypothetical protein
MVSPSFLLENRAWIAANPSSSGAAGTVLREARAWFSINILGAPI